MESSLGEGQRYGLIRLLAYLFHFRFCVEEKIAPDQRPHVLPVYFLGWLDQHAHAVDPDEVCQKAEVPRESWDFLREHVLDNAAGVERVTPYWWFIALSGRPDPKHKLRHLTLTAIYTFEDGSVYPVQTFAHRDMMSSGSFDDATVVTLVALRWRDLVSDFIARGTDFVHDERAADHRGGAPEDPFEVVMGLMLKYLIPQVKPELRPFCEKYMRLFQGIVRPVIPPGARQQLEEQKRLREQPGPARGGWDA
jgi:hypothetical protein